MGDEAWISVGIYGPQLEIDRFKRWFVVTTTDDRGNTCSELNFTGVFRHEGRYNPAIEAHGERPWNFEDWEQKESGYYSFKFDTWLGFPEELFERLSGMFPHLMFDCDYIASNDLEMGRGWYNGPKGGETFDYHAVPDDYWADGGCKRD